MQGLSEDPARESDTGSPQMVAFLPPGLLPVSMSNGLRLVFGN
jgi:hypothetical protein